MQCYLFFQGNPRNKCALKPGHSLMDWIRLGSSGVDLTGTKGVQRPIDLSELAKHCTHTDAWMAIHGKCYNVTRYLDFHPGGWFLFLSLKKTYFSKTIIFKGIDELMKGVGKDATTIFNEVHAWVNYEQLLAKCFIGPLIKSNVPLSEPTIKSAASAAQLSVENEDEDTSFKKPQPSADHKLPLNVVGRKASMATNSDIGDKSASLPVSPTESLQDLCQEAPSVEVIPRFDWIQKTRELVIVFYTRALCNPGFSVEPVDAKRVNVRIFIDKSVHLCCFTFGDTVSWPCSFRVANDTGKQVDSMESDHFFNVCN